MDLNKRYYILYIVCKGLLCSSLSILKIFLYNTKLPFLITWKKLLKILPARVNYTNHRHAASAWDEVCVEASSEALKAFINQLVSSER